METYDYIIVGAGSAGCVLADRLTACGRHSVLLVEAGGSDRHLSVRLPIGYGRAFHDARVNWRYHTEAEAELGGRSLYWPRGRVLGGSSAINGLVYIRGLPEDFDDWEAAGNAGWGWESVRPAFERTERIVAGDGRETGSGPLRIEDRSAEYHPVTRGWRAAAEEAGLAVADPARPVWGEGAGPYAITTRAGLRCSAADAFLRPAMRRPNLRLETRAIAARLRLEGRRATGLDWRARGRDRHATARRGVILAAGAIGSPTLLQRSGIGPGKQLAGLGIEVVHDNPAVGGGLQDHVGVDYLFRSTLPTLNAELGTVLGQLRAALVWAWRRGGPLSLSVNQMGGLVRSSPGLNRADMQLYFNPLSYTTVHSHRRSLLRPDPWPGFAIGFNACRPTSRGRVDIRDADPATPPAIRPNALSTGEDRAAVVAGGRLIERLLATRPFRALVAGTNGFDPRGAPDEALVEDFRARAGSVFHACGTCRIAPDPCDGVVDARLRVHGIDGLRVADASVFPSIPSANTNAPTLMVAQRAADMILEEG